MRFNKYPKMITKWAAGSNMKRAFQSKITNSSAQTKVLQLWKIIHAKTLKHFVKVITTETCSVIVIALDV